MSSFSSLGGSLDFDRDVPLSDRLKVFKSTNYDPESYVTTHCSNLSEKEIRHLCMHLVSLKKASAEEMRKSVYANYASFIRTSREISDLEGELVSLKNLLSSRANIIHSIADGVRVESLNDRTDYGEDAVNFEDREPTKIDKWLSQYLEDLEVLLAERRVEEALAALDEGDNVAEEARESGSMTPSALLSLGNSIMENRQKLADQLAESTCQPSINGFELRSSVQAMKQLGDGPQAHTVLLKCHEQKLHRNMQSLNPSSHGTAYITALSHLVFSTIAQAANDSLAIFSDEPAFTSELVTWAVNQTHAFAQLVKKNVVAAPAASGCLRIVAESVHICLEHCLLLEDRGLALCPTLLKIFKPYLEQALTANLKRIELCTAAIAASDNWSLTYPPVAGRSWGGSAGTTCGSQQKLSSSAHRFNTMIQFAETENLEGTGRRIVNLAETETQQLSLLANAVLLADELLPRGTIKFSSNTRSGDQSRRASEKRPPEQRELKRKLQRFVDQLRDSFCRQHALELIVTEDGGVRLSADIYLSMDESTAQPEWFPSPIYQELFVKLTRSKLLGGAGSWTEESRPLGLQQFYLDMEFVILFSSQGRYLSRNLHQVMKNVISRAIEAVQANGIDPFSVLPEDEWFADVAQIAIKMLTGPPSFEGDRDMTSPTAKSVSSVHSHGST
ncbi:Exocyst complex component EXO84A [Sesamum angolense]|uniref:Exocyst complex component EXO84A n=1 Tax=Sesamum angolense TaxID=2727404 RepID=A0AAE2BYY4_9LAMI|nr:Exocyst complex component EXO84A [Sesamum angolense]